MALTLEQAQTRLSNIDTGDTEALKNLINELSVEASGSKTILYSGMGEDFSKSLSNNPDIRIIDSTQAFKFLKKIEDAESEIQNQFKRILGNGDFGIKGSSSNQFLYGIDGNPRTKGAWDIISKNFVEAGRGDLFIYAGDKASPERVFFQTEWEAIKNNPNYTNINGVNYEKLINNNYVNMTSDEAFKAFQVTTKYRLDVATALGKNPTQLTDADVKDYFTNTQYTEQRNKFIAEKLNEPIPVDIENGGGKFTNFLNKLGIFGFVAGFILATQQSAEAYELGNEQKAKDIMGQWATEEVGATLGQISGAVIGSVTLGILATIGTTLGAIPAAIIIAGASLAGGIFGADFGTDFYENYLKDKDANGRLDMFDKLTNFFVGVGDLKDKLPQLIQTQNGTNKVELNLANLSKEVLITNAEISPAWMYALKYLNPFVIESKDAQMEDLLYSNENKDGSLEFENYSAEYLDKRAEMLLWRLKFIEENKNFTSEYNTDAIEGNWDFIDMSEHNKLPGGENLEFKIDGKGVSLYDHQVVFGSNKDDIIEGSGDNDFLFADAGNDTIETGTGINYIDGGTGSDTISYKNITNSNKEGITLNLSLATAQAINSTITDTIINIENVIGSRYADNIIGKDNSTTTLNGGFGNDTLKGGNNSENMLFFLVPEFQLGNAYRY